jgi:2',3'-cyclic-nucleotide 2'-phosphodiesterase (5'-nucleotidase family)
VRATFRTWPLCLLLFISTAIAQPRAITILHVNDIHGHFLPEQVSRDTSKILMGGFPALSFYLNIERNRAPNSLFMDAGDFMTGNPICNMKYRGAFGGALVELLEMTGCQVGCLGNHEFDISQENAKLLASISTYPILCANLVDSSQHTFTPSGTAIFEVNGLRIGVIGLILNDLSQETNPAHLRGLMVKDIAETAQNLIDQLDPVTDLIILLTHNGFDNDLLLARQIRNADVIVGGHSHTRLTEPARENGIVIVQAGSHLQDLGVLNLEVAGDTVYSYSGHLVPLLAEKIEPEPRVAAFCDSFRLLLDAAYGKVIGQLGVNWVHKYYEESNVGSWICDRMRQEFHTDIALVNAGGIRTDIPAGPVTKLQIAELLPFANSIAVFSTTGVQLRKFAEIQVRAQAFKEHGIVEMSGMQIGYRTHNKQIDTVTCEIAGKPIEDSRTYSVASIDYVVEQYERYLGFQPQSVQETGQLLSDFIMAQVQSAREPIISKVENRLRQLP